MNTLALDLKNAYYRRDFERRVKALVEKEDLRDWAKGFNSVIEPMEKDPYDIAREEEEQKWKDRHENNLRTAMESGVVGR